MPTAPVRRPQSVRQAPAPLGRIVAGGMLRRNTPVQDHTKEYGLWVKREDLACPPPGPPFSKARGVYAHLLNRPEKLIGVLDTQHSQAGWAVARACQVLGKRCVNYYPVFKRELDDNDPPQHELRNPQIRSKELGAEVVALPAGRSSVIYHTAKRDCVSRGGYMMPNALKLEESITETAAEVSGIFDNVLIAISSGTIAAGVIRGFRDRGGKLPQFLIHCGYSRSHEEVERYLREASGVPAVPTILIDEHYAYSDKASAGPSPCFPCNEYYDLKAFRWWMANREKFGGKTLFWNIG